MEGELADMLSCDSNGWTDEPEDEREELDRFFSDVVRPDLGSPVATPEGPAMTLTVHEAYSRPGVALPRRPVAPVLLRVLEFAIGALFFYLGGAKLLGSPAAVRLFHDIGWGQWFRYVTGVVELTGAVLLVVPRLAGASALLLMTVMVVATGIELFVLHRPPVAATACLCAHGIIAWNRRAQTRRLFAHRPHRSPPPVPVS
jgi:putative oxidoreductase